MNRCCDYPCCGHGPPPLGDGGGCPDAQGRFNCVGCGRKLRKGATSALCQTCVTRASRDEDWFDRDDGY